jgi:ubiquitin-conjugating enzyme E2 C
MRLGGTAGGKATSSGSAPAASAASTTKRLTQELMGLMSSGNKDVTAFPDNDNLFLWVGQINGTAGTVYEGLAYKIQLSFPPDYPFKAPTITFVNGAMYHPNVDMAGNICLDILKDKWSAAYSVSTILLSLQSLLNDPNPASPLNAAAAQQWENAAEFRKLVVARYKEITGQLPKSGWGSSGEI